MSSKDNLAFDLEHGVRRWDRGRWVSVFSSHSPTIREVTECLGLGLSASSSTTNRGIPKFDNPDYRKLSSEVTKLSKELPKERDVLLNFAADPLSLNAELEELLSTYGPAIWSRDADRACLLTPDPTKKTYTKDLFYEEPEHKEILKIHLHRWIIIKACYYIRNMKLKRASGVKDNDSTADLDGEVGSPRETPQSLTPIEGDVTAGAEHDTKAINDKKRKSTIHTSFSDGEERFSPPAKRPYHTMPIGSKSPPRPLKSLFPADTHNHENIPPVPSYLMGKLSHLSSPTTSGPETAKSQLGHLSSRELNEASRSPSTGPAAGPGGFTAVNSGSFTAVNITPPVQASAQDHSRPPSREPQRDSPAQHHRDTCNYTSPYESTTYSTTTPQHISEPRSVPSIGTTLASSQGFQAINSSVVTNGTDDREISTVRNSGHALIAPQPQQQTPKPAHTPQHEPEPKVDTYDETQSRPHSQILHRHSSAQSPSRASTPSGQHIGRPLALYSSSRSNTPLAPAASNNQPTSAPNMQAISAQVLPNAYAAPKIQSLPPNSLQHHTQAIIKNQPVEPFDPIREATSDLRLMQCEVLALLMQYLFPNPSSPPHEQVLLNRLNQLWYLGEPVFRPAIGAYYDLTFKILNAWLHERQNLTILGHSIAAQPGVHTAGLIDRLLAMNDLRAMRLKWKNMSAIDGVSPEDLLCRAFSVMTNTEKTEQIFKDGLERLNMDVFEFLRREDARIVVDRR